MLIVGSVAIIGLPSSAAGAIGLLVGIQLLLEGWMLIMASVAIHAEEKLKEGLPWAALLIRRAGWQGLLRLRRWRYGNAALPLRTLEGNILQVIHPRYLGFYVCRFFHPFILSLNILT